MLTCLIFFTILLSILSFIYFHFFQQKLTYLRSNKNNRNYQVLQNLKLKIKEWQENKKNQLKIDNYFKSHLLISKNIDHVLEDLTDLFLRDYFLDWYTKWSCNEPFKIKCLIKNEIWLVLSRLLSLLSNFDNISFFTKDLVNNLHLHFKRISIALECNKSYSLYNHLENSSKELDYLRNLSKFIFKLLLPSHYYSNDIIINFLQEIFALHVLQNFINLVSDPDFINIKVAEYIRYYRSENKKCHKNYAYTETYEDFINLINKCQNVQELKNIQYDVVCEIMQASALNNYKQERCDKDSLTASSSFSNVKGGLLLNRDLKRYINQLKFAKNLCSKKIQFLSKYALSSLPSSSNLLTYHQPPQKKIFNFNVIIANDNYRSFFKKFLQDSAGLKTNIQDRNSKYLLLLWEEIQEMKTKSDINPYKIANEILKHSYFLNSITFFTKLKKETRNGMELFVKGDAGPESFYQIQSLVRKILENRYYPLFIVSKEYDEMTELFKNISLHQNLVIYDNLDITNIKEKEKKNVNDYDEKDDKKNIERLEEKEEENKSKLINNSINEHILIANAKLKTFKQKIVDKGKAMDGLKECYDLSVNNFNYNLVLNLKKEVVELQEKIYTLENYINWCEQWIRHVGQWKAELYNIEINSNEQNSPSVIVILHFNHNPSNTPGSGGWIISRTISEFINLKCKCARICPQLKKIEILRLKNISSENHSLINKASENLQLFLSELFKDENCQKSEHVFLFFCPISKNVKSSSNRKNLLFASFFGINNFASETNQMESLNDINDELSNHFFNLEDELENKEDNIAEPLYNLLIEIFGTKGAIGFLRKTLITFVQIVGEKTINKEIKEAVSWMSSESMLFYYLCCLKEKLWPNGKLAKPWPKNTQKIKKQNQIIAKQLISENIPQILNHLFGQQNCRKGLLKIFEYFQDQNLNKQLIYDIIETFVLQFVHILKANQIK